MFCPVCNQEQISNETRFCSRCGFLLTGVSQLIASGGVLPQTLNGLNPGAISPRKKGVKQGALLVFSSFIIVPLVTMICIGLMIGPVPAMVAFMLTFVVGVLRMIYAALFESPAPTLSDDSALPEALKNVLPGKKQSNALPPQQTVPAASYIPPASGNWRETNDLMKKPPSVTDPTTKLLQKDE
jgi:hypothetical protein